MTHINKLLLLFLRHVAQAVVAAGEVSLQAGQSGHHHPLHLTPLGPGTGRGEAQPTNAAARPDARRQNVVLVEHPVF